VLRERKNKRQLSREVKKVDSYKRSHNSTSFVFFHPAFVFALFWFYYKIYSSI